MLGAARYTHSNGVVSVRVRHEDEDNHHECLMTCVESQIAGPEGLYNVRTNWRKLSKMLNSTSWLSCVVSYLDTEGLRRGRGAEFVRSSSARHPHFSATSLRARASQ